MSSQPPPSQYFPTIYYNPQFWSTSGTDNSNYLLRIGTPTSIATSTSFSGAVISNTLASTTTTTVGTDLNLTNRNKLSSVKDVSVTTTLVSGDPEYINIVPTSATAFTITLPRCDVSTKIGTKFSFFFTDPNGYAPLVTIQVSNSTFERIYETYSPLSSFIISSLNGTNTIELVSIAINSALPAKSVWSATSIAVDYALFAYVNTPNIFTDTNDFTAGSALVPTPLATDISTKAVNTTFLNSKLRVDNTLNNVSSGLNALANVTTGYNNLAFSTSANQLMTDGYNNIGIGTQANYNHNGNNNVAIGIGALTSGGSQIVTNNVAIGALALGNATTGCDGNFALGTNCLSSLSNGTNNCLMGYYGGGAMTTANYNSGVGFGVLNTITSGNNNSALGVGAGSGIVLGNSNTFLGTGSGASGDFSEGSSVGFGAVFSANNEIALGRATETVKVYGNLVTVGTTTSTGVTTATGVINSNGGIVNTGTITSTGAITATGAVNSNGGIVNTGTITSTGAITATGVVNSNGGIVNTGTITSTGRITANGGITNINGMNLFSSNTFQTGSFTISSPYFHIYPVAPTATQTITLPTPVVGLLGVTFTIRRVAGTSTIAINSATSNIYPVASFTVSAVILASGVFSTTITCTYLTAATFGWFKIA